MFEAPKAELIKLAMAVSTSTGDDLPPLGNNVTNCF